VTVAAKASSSAAPSANNSAPASHEAPAPTAVVQKKTEAEQINDLDQSLGDPTSEM